MRIRSTKHDEVVKQNVFFGGSSRRRRRFVCFVCLLPPTTQIENERRHTVRTVPDYGSLHT